MYHNKVNMHHDWDLVKMDIPAAVEGGRAEHYIVHFASRSPTDYIYTDAIDVNLHPDPVPEDMIYGTVTGGLGWYKVDHCQFMEPEDIVSPIRDATESADACRTDMQAKDGIDKPFGINIVPMKNPNVVPGEIVRDVETVSAVCSAPVCLYDTEGQCRTASGNSGGALCTPPMRAWNVAWANLAVSGKVYEALRGVLAGEYIKWKWDDVLHDVWLMPSAAAADSCNFTEATRLFQPAHHSSDYEGGRAMYAVPETFMGATLYFACAIQGHCTTGQILPVEVAATASKADASLKAGVCPKDYELCSDNSVQGIVGSAFKTTVNIPWNESRAAESLRIGGEVTRAATPWDEWVHRSHPGMVCRQRSNGQDRGRPGEGHKAWEFPDATLREVVEACSSNHPDICTGISWRRNGQDPATMYEGRHDFRRCLVTDGFTRIVHIGPSPTSSRKTVPCPGCYQCRENAKPPYTYLNYKQWLP